MKVLWFANTPCGASEKLNLNLNIGGWLTSLEEQLVQIETVQLSVSFYWGEDLDPFLFGKTTYYPVFREGSASKAGRLVNRVIKTNNESRELQKLLAVVKEAQPDIIHVHGTENNFGLIQYHTNIPVVVSIQGILSVYLQKYFSGIPSRAAIWHERLIPKLLFRSVRFNYNNLEESAKRERRIFTKSKHIIGRTGWDKRISHLFAPESHYYLGNEIIRVSFYDKKWSKKKFDTPLRLVTVMSGGLYKGFESVVKAAMILRKENAIAFEWTIIGQTESTDMVKIVKRWLKVDSLKALNINLVGSKNEEDVASILLESDIFCQVSHIENSPNSLCEAMLLGMPVIATFAGGTDSILENRKEGLLIQDGDAYSLAAAVIEMADNFSTASNYGNDAQNRARMRHDKKDITNKLIDTYTDILHTEKTNK